MNQLNTVVVPWNCFLAGQKYDTDSFNPKMDENVGWGMIFVASRLFVAIGL